MIHTYPGAAFLLGVLWVATPPAKAQETPKAPAPTAAPQPAKAETTFRVGGAVTKPQVWTVERLAREFASEIKTVEYVHKGNKGQARCVLLLSVLKASEPRLNPKAKNHLLAFAVLVRGYDGYTVSFSSGEMQAEYGKRDVWIALDRNAQPLPAGTAPVEILVPGDEKPSRWVRGVAQIVLVDGLQLTNQ